MKRMIKLFLVDDDLCSLAVYQQGLESMGYRNCQLFFSGRHCLDHIHQHPDIVFLDYHLDDMPGLEVLETIKRYNPSIQVVMVSGQGDVKVVMQALKRGAFDYLVKGDDELQKMEEVISRIESLGASKTTLSPRSSLNRLSVF